MTTHTTTHTTNANALRVVIAAAGQLANLIAQQPAGHNPAAQRASAVLCAHLRRHATAAETTAIARHALAYFSNRANNPGQLRAQATAQLDHIAQRAQQTLQHLDAE